MRKLWLILALVAILLQAEEFDECAPPDVYGDWASIAECEEYHFAQQEEEEEEEENEDD